jgi:NADPH-dependent 2,4-dienoyl-CoA reductase/sulfur reductase-like enzyme
MKKRILIVGGVAGGASVAARARRIDENAEIIMFEKGPHVSFSNCSLPFHLSGIVENSDDLVLMCPTQFKKQYNIEARVNTEVTKIKREEKKIVVKDLVTGEEYEEAYDKLVLSPGANPIRPKSIEGVTAPNVFTVRNVVDIKKLNDYIVENNIEDIAVIGGGFIGVEVTENLRLAGKNVSLIEALDQIMSPFDYDMAQILHKEMIDKGVNLILRDGVKKINEDSIELQSGKKLLQKS